MTLIDQIHTPAAEVANPADAWTPTRAAARFALDAQRIAELERSLTETRQRLTAAESDQITSGTDPRLHDFWVRAGETADEEQFCDEYDRLAEAMGGVPREREFNVEMEVTVTFTTTQSATCRDSDDAYAIARDNLTESDLREAMSWVSLSWETEEVSTDRA
ncbi:hypothetical protein VH571_15895 [Frondihabitans sp. 4ASC-45]|uniref:hypothetical protein n=1 Tax=Frondihabitans sp. 4ASC-45 TaxID=3111636 RepID=UPI003C1AA93E